MFQKFQVNNRTWVLGTSLLFATFSLLFLYLRNKNPKKRVKSKVPVSERTVSCPGKILLCGGYLVLDRSNIGVTIAANSARFYSTVKLNDIVANPRPSAVNAKFITVQSPQFSSEYKFIYKWDEKEDSLSYADGEQNLFVFKCLALSLPFIRKHLGNEEFRNRLGKEDKELIILLRANNDFYSQVAEVSPHYVWFLTYFSITTYLWMFSYKRNNCL